MPHLDPAQLDAQFTPPIERCLDEPAHEAAWEHEWNWQTPRLCEFDNYGKRLGNKRLSQFQCIKVGPLADALEDIGEVDAAQAMRRCGCYVIVDRYERGTVFRAMTECNHLVCPTAQRRRAAKLVEEKGGAIERYIRRNPGSRPLMATLTTKAVAAYDLWVAVDQIFKAFSKFTRRVAIKRAFLAWLRSLEISRNPQTGLFMVHLHCIFIVGPDYFKPGSKEYLSFEKLRAAWKASLRADYDPMVRIEKMRGGFAPLTVTGRKSLQEALKYCFKPGAIFYTKTGGRPAIVGATTRELFDPNDGKGLRWLTNVPLRAIIQALKDRRLVETSGNLKGNLDLDFTDDPDAETRAHEAELGEFICSDLYAWREVRGRGDFFFVGRSFERPANEGGFAMGP
ncbi:plasmid rolling circle replication initiator protein [Bradyrhizobium sp. YR681]|uniref:protein rep n=1 Tax=Bradyrhizobium sp. YR681 TaxID=1144344 RepID=UPI000270F567|nr:protein rep [Bradyrhizobium sp. YR681]EJN16311.1 plasmid rolling circle replication initiator protein [Bradyrhizobium sp. YR681]